MSASPSAKLPEVGTHVKMGDSKLKLIDATQKLCFNQALFARSDFDIDRFLSALRRRASLSQIQMDLRTYLRVVQNAMIELINDDYADFVSLSSNLVGLKDTVDKFNGDIASLWKELCTDSADAVSAGEVVERSADQLIACRFEQFQLRTQIVAILAVEKLADCIVQRPDKLCLNPIWLEKLVNAVVDVEVWFHKIEGYSDEMKRAVQVCKSEVQTIVEQELVTDLMHNCRYVDTLLSILMLIDGCDSAASVVIADVISKMVDQKSGDLSKLLSTVFADIVKLRREWIEKMKENEISIDKVLPFLNQCLLTFVISILDKRFESVLVPCDGALFHECYLEMIRFVQSWPDADNSRTLLAMIRDRFNLTVFFKLETHEPLALIDEEISKAPAIRINDLPDVEEPLKDSLNPLFCRCSSLVMDGLTKVWNDDVYLPTLSDKFWDFTVKLLLRYIKWIDAVSSNAENGNEECDRWQAFVAVFADIISIDSRAFSLALTNIWGKFRKLGLDVTMFGQCLSSISSLLSSSRKNVESKLVDGVVFHMSKAFEGVFDIPRHYRWTKKPSPDGPSQYISNAFVFMESLEKECRIHCWSDEDIQSVSKRIFAESCKAFCSKAKEVIESVEQTGSSLQRFKKKTVSSIAENGGYESDDEKIRKQLFLDLKYCRDFSISLQIDTTDIEALMTRAFASEER